MATKKTKLKVAKSPVQAFIEKMAKAPRRGKIRITLARPTDPVPDMGADILPRGYCGTGRGARSPANR